LLGLGLIALSLGTAFLIRQQSVTESALHQAEERLALARRTVDEVYDRIASDWIANNRRLSAVQRELLINALHTYEQLATETHPRPETRYEVANAYRRAADIRNRLGMYDDARSDYERAAAIQQRLVDSQPENTAYRDELWGTYLHFGNLLLSTGQLSEANQMYTKARKHVVRLAREISASSEFRLGITACDLNIASVLMAKGKPEEAETVIRRCYEQFGDFRSDRRPAYLARWAETSGMLAAVLRKQGRLEEAETLAQEALTEISRVTRGIPDSRQFQRLEARINGGLADILAAMGNLEEAVEHYQESLGLQQRALPFGMTPREYAFATMGKEVEDRFEEPEAHCNFADTQCRLGIVLYRLGERKEAERLFDEAASTCNVQILMAKHVLSYRAAKARALHELGSIRIESEPKQAKAHFEEAVALCRQLAHEAPQVVEYRTQLSQSLSQLAWLLSYGQDTSIRLQNSETSTFFASRGSLFVNEPAGRHP
jgi:tetratricopeptide (TPR) repeat protein